MRRIRALRNWRPLAVGGLVAVVLVAAWRGLVQPRFPVANHRQIHESGPLHWFDGDTIPAYLTGPEVTPETWLVLGDSRVFHAIDPPSLAAAGIEPVTMLWIGGAYVEELLVAARELPARRLVVALTPLSVYRERDVDAERSSARRRATIPWRRRVDEALDVKTDEIRALFVRWVATRTWNSTWFDVNDPAATDPVLRRALAPRTRDIRREGLDRIAKLLQELEADGREITCVRFPISLSLKAIEEEAFDSDLFVQMTRDLGIPYYDDSEMPLPTLDGSHVSFPSARSYARVLAEHLLSR